MAFDAPFQILRLPARRAGAGATHHLGTESPSPIEEIWPYRTIATDRSAARSAASSFVPAFNAHAVPLRSEVHSARRLESFLDASRSYLITCTSLILSTDLMYANTVIGAMNMQTRTDLFLPRFMAMVPRTNDETTLQSPGCKEEQRYQGAKKGVQSRP